jgi:outer membrane protein
VGFFKIFKKYVGRKMKSISKQLLACFIVFASSSAFAQKAGDNIIGLGIASINPDTSVGQVVSVGNDPTSNAVAGAFNTANVGLRGSIASQKTISASWLHMYSDNMGLDFLFGIPPKLTLDSQYADGTTLSNAATVKTWTPAVVAKYFFNTPQDKIRPYVGLGVSYVSFHSVTPSNAESLQALAGNGASLSSTWTPVYSAGLIYNLDERWSINAGVSYLPVRTTATYAGKTGPVNGTTVPANGVTTKVDLGLNTTDYVIRLGYKF